MGGGGAATVDGGRAADPGPASDPTPTTGPSRPSVGPVARTGPGPNGGRSALPQAAESPWALPPQRPAAGPAAPANPRPPAALPPPPTSNRDGWAPAPDQPPTGRAGEQQSSWATGVAHVPAPYGSAYPRGAEAPAYPPDPLAEWPPQPMPPHAGPPTLPAYGPQPGTPPQGSPAQGSPAQGSPPGWQEPLPVSPAPWPETTFGPPGHPALPPAPPVGALDPRAELEPGVTRVPQQPYPEAGGVVRMPAQPASAYPEPVWPPDGSAPTAEEFARRRASRPADPVATMGVRAAVNKTTLGLVRLAPGRHEQEFKQDIEMVRRNFGGLRQVTVVNPKGGAGKTVAILLLAMTFGQKRGGYVLAWDNNETQGTLGMRAQQDFHSRTVRDMMRDLGQFQGAHGRVGDLSQYVRSQGEGMFDVLASDESATGGEMLTASAFGEIREVVSRFYKLIFVDTGNNVRAQNWQAAIDATDQLLVTMSARNDSAETAARMLDHLEQSGRQRLVRQAVTVVSMPPSRKEIDLPSIERHFSARTRAVLLAPYERLIDAGEPLRYGQLTSATRDAWLKIAAAVAEGL
jgi:MinD-like ATPase involved in chromosome partitioning or flagellar assembly